jgi:hypothetical protein
MCQHCKFGYPLVLCVCMVFLCTHQVNTNAFKKHIYFTCKSVQGYLFSVKHNNCKCKTHTHTHTHTHTKHIYTVFI